VTPPRFDADLVVRADLELFGRMWLGHFDYDSASRCGTVVVEGPRTLAKQLPRWLMWSPMAGFVREHERTLAQAARMRSQRPARASSI